MNRSLDYRADLYSLGITLYELFTGALPHVSIDPLEMVHFHIAGKPVPPSDRDARVPEALSEIVLKLLQKEPEDRYQSASGLAGDLRRCLAALDSGGSIERFPLGLTDAIDRFDPPQKLYGRGAETKALLSSFERVARGRVETITVAGQPGIGKTSLVQEIYQPITRQRGYFVAGKFDLLQQNVPFSALVTALQDLVQQLLTEGEEEIAAWRAAIQSAVHPNGQLIVDVVPALELIIGPQPRVAELEALEAQNRFNLAFQNFVQVFCKKSHPLVLFLDDMQWADPASLNLITLVVSARATESLLLVLTYRDTEVAANHPFMLAVKEQAKQGVPVQAIELAPLGVPEVAEFVADTLHQDRATAMPLAEVIQQKTAGNPFFMRQFLQALYGAQLISFDGQEKRFRYDVAAVKNAAITENVAELLATKLQRLPESTQRTLRVAAVIGSRFELRLLANVQEQSAAATDESLRPAIEAGLIAPLTGLESVDADAFQSPLVYGRFAFRHDRVQQAAYVTVAESERPGLHLAIGRAWLAMTPVAKVESLLFDIVGHLNDGRALITDEAERLRLADLNRRVGIKARDSTAYLLAVSSFRTAIELDGEPGLDHPLRGAIRHASALGRGAGSDGGRCRSAASPRACARACRLADRPHDPERNQDERAADHGANSGSPRVRARRGAGVRHRPARATRPGARIAAARDSDRSRACGRPRHREPARPPADERPRSDCADRPAGALHAGGLPNRSGELRAALLHDGPVIARAR